MACPITKFRFLLITTSSSLISMIYSSVFESSFDLDFIYSIINFQFYLSELFLSLNDAPDLVVSFCFVESDLFLVYPFIPGLGAYPFIPGLGASTPCSETSLEQDDGSFTFSTSGSLKITSCNDNLTFFSFSLTLSFSTPLMLSCTPFLIEYFLLTIEA